MKRPSLPVLFSVLLVLLVLLAMGLALLSMRPSPSPVPAPVPAPDLPRSSVPARVDGPVRIALVIDDLGLSAEATREVIALPAPLTLAFLPYAPSPAPLLRLAQAGGHELILHQPMEPVGRADPGPQALMVDLGVEALQQRLNASLDALPGVRGMNNHMGSRFTAVQDRMTPVLEVLQARGLYFLDSLTTPSSTGAMVATHLGLPHARRDVFLDDELRSEAIAAQLDRTEQLALSRGRVIAIGHPHPQTLALLKTWIPAMQAKGYQFVAVSSLLLSPSVEPRQGAGKVPGP